MDSLYTCNRQINWYESLPILVNYQYWKNIIQWFCFGFYYMYMYYQYHSDLHIFLQGAAANFALYLQC